jgi:S-DNA-T family DNA segregation ATPase FtsK/SpoIIIE
VSVASRRRTSRRRGRSAPALPSLHLDPDVTRTITSLVLLILGAVTLIALLLPGEGRLTDWWRDSIAPWFGTSRWLLPFVLLACGGWLAWRRPTAWVHRIVAALIAFVALQAMIGLLVAIDVIPGRSGGRFGNWLADELPGFVTVPGAFVVLVIIALVALGVALDRPLRTVFAAVGRGVRSTGTAIMGERPPAQPSAPMSTAGGGVKVAAVSRAASPGQPGIWGPRDEDRPEIPAATPSAAPVSSMFAPAAGDTGAAAASTATSVAVATAPARVRDPDEVTDASDSGPTSDEPPYALPPVTLLDDVAPRSGGSGMDHERNAAIIGAKLASFNIPARVVRWNAGPVVTQYEIEPDPSVKVSRIEALADDLSMALAARTIRIEAPIPGKSVVGLEIPNSDFNVVALRRILDETDFAGSGSRLTFALGRDVAGHARAADLAKMPHLLIAGATGSGKSVMVNAFITSLLMNASPDDVRMILVDLKRVELAAYNDLPHLLVQVITEPGAAKASLRWAVGEMEARYRRFAADSARNITSYNETRADQADRMPYIVIVVDELADLMMREGKNVEDPIVRLAQKARATGIHMVLATQRPSVNVVTGLIKANFPSRIAFAMASQIDSRTILDAPGAEDLIGRGDMLFQPADMPRPIRLQGVFVADREIRNVTEYWRSWDHHYDLGIVASDDETVGSVEDRVDEDADRLLPDAIDVIREYDRASASLLQRRLRIGYARAARIIDQLETRGYVGPPDGSNARQVLRRDTGSGGGGDDEIEA